MAEDGRVIVKIDGDDSGFQKKLAGLKKAGEKALSILSKAAVAAGAALAGVGVYAIKVGSDFETGMSKVQAISGASGAELEQLKDKAKEMGATTKFSATQSAEALQYMAMAGWKTEQMTAGLPGIMNLAAASGENLASVSDIVTDALTAFGLQAEDSAHFADVLATASSNSNTNVSMMGETFKYVAPVAGALGYSIEDTAVAIGLMANSGIKAEIAGTSLRGMLTNLAKPTRMTAKYIEDLGLSLTDSGGQMKPLSALIDELREKFFGLTEAQKAEYAAGVAGKEGMSGLLAIVNASTEEYEKLSAAIASSDGAAKRMADTMNDNLRGQMTLLGSNIEGVGIQIYESLETPLKEAVKSVNDSVSRIAKSLSSGQLKTSLDKLAKAFGKLVESAAQLAAKAIPKMINAFAFVVDHGKQIATVILAAVAAVQAFKAVSALGLVVKSWQQAAKAVSLFAMGQTAAAFETAVLNGALSTQELIAGVVTGKIGLATAAQAAWNAVTAANPFIIAATAIAALVAGIGILIAAQQEEKSEAQQFAKRQKEITDAINKQREAREQLQQAAAESLSASDTEIRKIESYVRELDKYKDAQGRVSEAHQARADYLMDEINSLIPGAVEKLEDEAGAHYKIIDSIDDEIFAKRKSALLDAMQEGYNEALAKRIEVQNKLTSALKEQKEAQSGLKDAMQRCADIQAVLNDADKNAIGKTIDFEGVKYSYAELEMELTQSSISVNEWKGKLDEANTSVAGAQAEVNELQKTISGMDAASAAETPEALNKAWGEFSASVQHYSSKEIDAVQTATSETIQTYKRRREEIQAHYEAMDEAARANADSELENLKAHLVMMADAAAEGGGTLMSQWIASIEAGKPDIDTAMKLIADGVLSAADVAQELDSLGQAAMKNYGAGLSEQQGAAQSAMQEGGQAVIAQAQTIADGILVAADVCAQMKQIGENIAEGLASGIASRQVAAVQSAVNMMNAVVQKSKEAVDTHSPSRVFRNEIGRMIAEGLALGIEDGGPAVAAAITQVSETAIRVAKDEAGSYQELGEKYMENLSYGVAQYRDASIAAMEKSVQADVDAYVKAIDAQTETLVGAKQKQIEEISAQTDTAKSKQAKAEVKARKEALQKEIDQIKSAASEQKKAYEQAGKQVTSSYKTIMTEGYQDVLEAVKTQVSAITAEAQKQYDDITKAQNSMRDKLSGYGELFKIGDEQDLSLGKIELNIEAIKRYDEALSALVERGVSEEFLTKITALGVDEGTKFAEKLVSLSKSGFDEYLSAWDEQQQLSADVASKFYARQLDILDKDFNSKITQALSSVPETMGAIGSESIQSWANGALSQFGGASQEVKDLITKTVGDFGAAGQNGRISDGGAEIVSAFAGSITKNAPLAVSAAQSIVQMVSDVMGGLVIPAGAADKDGAAENGAETTGAFAGGIAAQAQQVADAALETAQAFTSTILSNLPEIDKTGNEVVYALAHAIEKRQAAIRERALQTVRSFCDTVNARYSTFQQTGLYAMQGLEAGLREGGESAIETAAWVADQIVSEMQRALDIHSPSRKMAKLVGAPAAQGVAVGFDEAMGDVYRRIHGAMDAEMGKLSSGIRVQADREALRSNPAPVQTIYKSSVVEKQPVIEFRGNLAALGRAIEPYIRVETKRRGGSLVKGEL